MDSFLGLLASIPLWYLAVAFAYLIGLFVIAGITWPFRHLPPTSPWYINEEGFHLRIGVVISAIAIGLARGAFASAHAREHARRAQGHKDFPDVFEQTKVTADAGYHSGASVAYTQENGIDAYIADRSHRQRDPAFADYDRYKIRFRKDKRRYYGMDTQRFTAKDFIYDEKDRSCRCPAGNRLYRNGSHININGFIAMKFRGAKLVCGPCILRQRCCLKTPETTETNQVTIFIGRSEGSKDSPIEKMRRKFDTYLAGSSTTNGSP
jgi:hypothetical protein